MESFFEDQPFTLPSTPKRVDEGYELVRKSPQREDTDDNSTRVMPSRLSLINPQDQRTSINNISQDVQRLIEKVNSNRSSDLKMIDHFQEQMIALVTEMCQQMKSCMYSIYEANSAEMQPKLQEVSELLENCVKVSGELEEANQELSGLLPPPVVLERTEPK
ncbi:synaptonemal complex central element protein 2 isoform X2 [Antennarius striatus]|uniref:synaptonemal complex central element protein 2 isoform X2 n=1 Tax=Antennarius striatus TaxID=241820 RepID=UPI0035B30897